MVISDVSKDIPELILVEKVANKVYAWPNNSTKRTHEILELLEQMRLDAHRPLQIHNIRWLSRGQVMETLVSIMPTILTIWTKENLNEWYNKACIYSIVQAILVKTERERKRETHRERERERERERDN